LHFLQQLPGNELPRRKRTGYQEVFFLKHLKRRGIKPKLRKKAMSEYQYYEFLAIDRPLTEDEIDDLRAPHSPPENLNLFLGEL
jgi:site-specific recombinase XerC